MTPRTFGIGEAKYPITITGFGKNKGDKVTPQDSLVTWTFKFKRVVGDPVKDEERVVVETGVGGWYSPTKGTIDHYKVRIGDVISRDQPLVVIEEPCPHDAQFMGMCAKCGELMDQVNFATQKRDTERATIAMVHDNTALMVSDVQATRAEMDLQRRLLEQHKLSLVVDLDQTIIHACIEPTVGEWQKDPTNPNYEAVKDVKSFQLDDNPRVVNGCWYYIKMRPGLRDFLERLSSLFELHIYTMGTRAYALEIAKIVDPTRKLFAHRIISRDENGSMTAKTLQRLFPVNTNMVLVIDDRADVWPENRDHLIKVMPYDFFKGVGDINAAFLPRRDDVASSTNVTVAARNAPNGAYAKSASAKTAKPPEAQVPTGSSNEAALQDQSEEQERTLEKQLTERPLLHMQEELDKDASGSDDAATLNSVNVSATPPSQQHQSLLRDDDCELDFVEAHLTETHRKFYAQYDAACRRSDEYMVNTVPNVGYILSRLKKPVLRHCVVVLSGLVPLGADIRKSDIGLQVLGFGAELRTKLTSKTTHLVISSSRPRTQKVRQALEFPHIKIVSQDWIYACIARWKRVDENPFLIDVHPADRAAAASRMAQPRVIPKPSDQESPETEQDSVEESDLGSDGSDDEDIPATELYGFMPADQPDNAGMTPLSAEDMAAMDADMKEFLDEMDDDGDTGSEMESEWNLLESSQDTDSEYETARRGKKRKKDDEDTDAEEGSALAKKQRLAKARTTGLRNVENVGEAESLPEPRRTGDEQDANGESHHEPDAEDDEDLDFDAELEAEFEAAIVPEEKGEKG